MLQTLTAGASVPGWSLPVSVPTEQQLVSKALWKASVALLCQECLFLRPMSQHWITGTKVPLSSKRNHLGPIISQEKDKGRYFLDEPKSHPWNRLSKANLYQSQWWRLSSGGRCHHWASLEHGEWSYTILKQALWTYKAYKPGGSPPRLSGSKMWPTCKINMEPVPRAERGIHQGSKGTWSLSLEGMAFSTGHFL